MVSQYINVAFAPLGETKPFLALNCKQFLFCNFTASSETTAGQNLTFKLSSFFSLLCIYSTSTIYDIISFTPLNLYKSVIQAVMKLWKTWIQIDSSILVLLLLTWGGVMEAAGRCLQASSPPATLPLRWKHSCKSSVVSCEILFDILLSLRDTNRNLL